MSLIYTSGTTEIINIGEVAGYRISAVLFPGTGIPVGHFYIGVVECKPAQTKLTDLSGLPTSAAGVFGDLALGTGIQQYKFPSIDLAGVDTQITQEYRTRILWFSYAGSVDGLATANVPGQPKEDRGEDDAQVNALPNGLLRDEYKFELSSAAGPHDVENLLSFQSHQDPSTSIVRFSSVANKSNSWLAEILRLHNSRVGPQGNIPESNVVFTQLPANGPMEINANDIQSLAIDHCVGYMVGSPLPDLHRVAHYVKDFAAIAAKQREDQTLPAPSYPDRFQAAPFYNKVPLAQAIEVATIGFKQGYYSYDALMAK